MSVADTVVEILKKHGEWVESSVLVKKIAKERNISERQAYRDLKKSWKDDKIRKIKLPDGVVLNGLSNWPFPSTSLKREKETLTFQDAFLYRCFKRLEDISKVSVYKPFNAFLLLGDFVAMLPASQKEKLKRTYQDASKAMLEIQKGTWPHEMQTKARAINRHLIDKISTLLHEQLESR